MDNTDADRKGYVIAVALGAVGGGLGVALATRAIPKMFSQIMRNMMRSMMTQMGADGCDPGEM